MTQRILLLLSILLLVGCAPAPESPVTPTGPDSPPTSTTPPKPTDTQPPPPTPTEVIAYAAFVNDEGIRQTSFDASLLQLELALKEFPDFLEPGETPDERVIEDLVNRMLLSQAAREAGLIASPEKVSEYYNDLVTKAGGQEALDEWFTAYGYTQESFMFELPYEIEAGWQRDQIAAQVPETMEQVLARQLLFYDAFQAKRVYDQLQAGIAMETIIQNNDPNNLGYMDWFPRGVLLIPELEEVMFSLAPGEYSQVIETLTGYHILFVMAVDPAHPLSHEVKLLMQEQAIRDWLAGQRSRSEIEINIP